MRWLVSFGLAGSFDSKSWGTVPDASTFAVRVVGVVILSWRMSVCRDSMGALAVFSGCVPSLTVLAGEAATPSGVIVCMRFDCGSRGGKLIV